MASEVNLTCRLLRIIRGTLKIINYGLLLGNFLLQPLNFVCDELLIVFAKA